MIIWGFGRERVELGPAQARECGHCAHRRPFRHVLRYRFVHIWYLFCWVTEKQYLAVCDICHHAVPQDTQAFEAALPRSPIPFYRRSGWVVLLGLVAVVGAASYLRSRRSEPVEELPSLASAASCQGEPVAMSARYLSFSRT